MNNPAGLPDVNDVPPKKAKKKQAEPDIVQPEIKEPVNTNSLIVNADLVDLLSSVKTMRIAEVSEFFDELKPMIAMMENAKTEKAKRRHALSIMLLIKEWF